MKFTVAAAVDDTNRGSMTSLVESLYSGLLGGDITFVAGTIQMVTSSQQATVIKSAAAELGIAVSEKPTT